MCNVHGFSFQYQPPSSDSEAANCSFQFTFSFYLDIQHRTFKISMKPCIAVEHHSQTDAKCRTWLARVLFKVTTKTLLPNKGKFAGPLVGESWDLQ